MILPESFKSRMKNMLGSEYDEFIASFDEPSVKGIRINTRKVEPSGYEDIAVSVTGGSSRVPWTSCGFYTGSETSGKDPYYHAGVFYPQDPSAMLPAEIIAAKPGEFILDLCAAPGGKACRIGEDLRGEGLLVANEINAERSKALNRNIERSGITNCVILNESPDRIAERLPGFFDKILIDAPCSGEGMFRRDPRAVKSWQDYGPEQISKVQHEILEQAVLALRPGGEIVYSTCTFAEIEDELMIDSFLKDHSDFVIVPHPGISEITHKQDGPAGGSMRIWPHKCKGDGHFCVHLKNTAPVSDRDFDIRPRPSTGSIANKITGKVIEMLKEVLNDEALNDFKARLNERVLIQGSGIYLMPVNIRLFDRLKVVKSGLFIGEVRETKTERIFVPSNSLPLTLTRDMVRDDSLIILGRNDDKLTRYLKGETVVIDLNEHTDVKRRGYVLITADGYPLGFGKIDNGMIKNMYPKAWRLL